MARLHVYRSAESGALLVDCQSDFLDHLQTRQVAPLLDSADALDQRLNPPIIVEGRSYVFAPQFLAAVPVNELKRPVAWLRDDDYAIGRALDLVFGSV